MDLFELGPFPKVGCHVSTDMDPQATNFQKVLHTSGISLGIFLRVCMLDWELGAGIN